MYTIPIDEQNFHTNSLSENELLWGKTTYKRVLARYHQLNQFIGETLQPLNLNKAGTERLLTTVTLAFCHTMQNSKQPTTQEQMDKTLKAWLNSFLPFIVQNLLHCRYSHPIQFEPIATYCHYVANNYQKAIIDLLDSAKIAALSEFELFLLLEFINLFRAISSSIMLFFIGDDVHGISLYRGVLEIFSKLAIAPEFREEYVLFKNFNIHLQIKKHSGEPLPLEMIEYLKNEPLYHKNPESFLAYGWAKDHQGNRILSMKQLISSFITASPQETNTLLQLASEFTHEDYVGIGYNYVALRKEMIDYYYILLRKFGEDEIFHEICPQLLKTIRHLQNQTDPIYSGKIPLTDK